MSTVVDELLAGEPSLRAFMDRHYQKVPLPHPGGARALAGLGSWETLAAIFARGGADVLVSKLGKPLDGPLPATFERARELFADGHTITIRSAETKHDGLAALARRFEEAFRAPVNVHFYATPPGLHGFGWHYDVEDVFLVQTGGRKEYFFKRNTVNPWPRLDQMPVDLGFEREGSPTLATTLAAGDWLYLPAGWWHVARASTEESLSLAVGVLSTNAIDVLDKLRERLLRSIFWRQRMPVAGLAAGATRDELRERYRAALKELGKDLARSVLDDPFVDSFLPPD